MLYRILLLLDGAHQARIVTHIEKTKENEEGTVYAEP